MKISNTTNNTKYNFITRSVGNQGKDSYIFASSSSSLDVYSNEPEPMLLFKTKPIPTGWQTFFFDYSPVEKILPYIIVEEYPDYSTQFLVCKVGKNSATCEMIKREVDPIDFKNNISHSTGFAVSPTRMLISHFRYSFLCCEYSTNPLEFTVTKIPVCFRDPMCMFKTKNENVVCFLAFGCLSSYTVRGANRRYDTPHSFYFVDTEQKKECSYMGEGDNKTNIISFHVYEDSILTAAQDPDDRHKFKLVGNKKIYEVTLEELFARNVEIAEEILRKPIEESVSNASKDPYDFKENPKMANINHLEIAESKTTITEFVVRTIQINKNEHLIIDYVGKVCYFNYITNATMCLENDTFKNKIVEDVREVYRDENLVIIWVVLQYDGGLFIKVNRNHVLDPSGHNLNKDFSSKNESEKNKLFSLNMVKQMEFINDINKTVLSKQGNLYQIDEKLVCSNNNMGRALFNGVINSKPVSKTSKLYKTYSNFNKTTHKSRNLTNLNNGNTHKTEKTNIGDFNITTTKDYKLKLTTTNNQIDLLPKERTIKIDGSSNTKSLFDQVSMHVTASKIDGQIVIYMLDSDNIVYKGVIARVTGLGTYKNDKYAFKILKIMTK